MKNVFMQPWYSIIKPEADLGGCSQHMPPLFFAEIGRLTLCGRLMQKMHRIVQSDFEN